MLRREEQSDGAGGSLGTPFIALGPAPRAELGWPRQAAAPGGEPEEGMHRPAPGRRGAGCLPLGLLPGLERVHKDHLAEGLQQTQPPRLQTGRFLRF